MVATVPRLEAIAFLGGTDHLFCIGLQFQCTCISGWPGLNSPQKREGAEGGWAHMPCPNDGCPPGFAMLNLPAHLLPDPCQLQVPTPPMHPRQLTGIIRTETRSDFNSVLRDLGPDPEGDLVLHPLPLLPHPTPEQGFLSNRCWPCYPLPRESSAAPTLSRTHASDS